MKKKYISELVSGTYVEETFVLASKEMRTSRAGKTYLIVSLSDKTGAITGYHFAPSSYEAEIPAGAAVSVHGIVGEYRDNKKITIEAMAPASKTRSVDFLEHSRRPREEMLAELRSHVAKVKDPVLARLLRAVFKDREFLEQFCLSPASQARHHAYLGGLLEHTISVATLCAQAAQHYSYVQSDVLIAAAILHDIGQVEALEYDTTIKESAKGRLLGHSMLSLRRLREAARIAGIEENTPSLVDVEHAITTHHGEEEGAGHKPATLEAVILHDMNAADIHTAEFLLATVGALRADEKWTTPNNPFKRSLQVPQSA